MGRSETVPKFGATGILTLGAVVMLSRLGLMNLASALVPKSREAECGLKMHVQNWPEILDYYRKIEADMRMLIARERATPDAFDIGPVKPAVDIRRGIKRPHPRHWLKLAELVGAVPRP